MLPNSRLEAPDEDYLPFKTIYALQARGARIFIEPEALHPLWNINKGALKRSDLQSSFLKGILMTQVESGPFFSGTNKLTKKKLRAMQLNQCLRQHLNNCRKIFNTIAPAAKTLSQLSMNSMTNNMMNAWTFQSQKKTY